MERDVFLDHLRRASARCREFSMRFVLDALPDAFIYWVDLNCSYDGNLNEEHEVVFPDDIEKHGSRIGPLTALEVVALLWRNGMVPEWIDITVIDADVRATCFELSCCGRFTRNAAFLYYSETNAPPFGVKGPAYPARLLDAVLRGERVEKFTLAESRGEGS